MSLFESIPKKHFNAESDEMPTYFRSNHTIYQQTKPTKMAKVIPC